MIPCRIFFASRRRFYFKCFFGCDLRQYHRIHINVFLHVIVCQNISPWDGSLILRWRASPF